MDYGEVADATMTWARDAAEERLLRESLPLLAGLGAPVFVTDGGSGEEFARFLRSLPGVEVCAHGERGPWAQAGRSLRAAHGSGRRFILYTESDKLEFFRAGQRGDDARERLYRMRQLSEGVEGLVKAAAADLSRLSCRG